VLAVRGIGNGSGGVMTVVEPDTAADAAGHDDAVRDRAPNARVARLRRSSMLHAREDPAPSGALRPGLVRQLSVPMQGRAMPRGSGVAEYLRSARRPRPTASLDLPACASAASSSASSRASSRSPGRSSPGWSSSSTGPAVRPTWPSCSWPRCRPSSASPRSRRRSRRCARSSFPPAARARAAPRRG